MNGYTTDNYYFSYNYDPVISEYIIAIPTIRDDDGTLNILNSRFSVVFGNDTLGFYQDVGETVSVGYGNNEISDLVVWVKESEWVGIDQSFYTHDWYAIVEYTDDAGNKEELDTRNINLYWSLPQLDPTLGGDPAGTGTPDDDTLIQISSSTFDENLDSNSVIAQISADYSSPSISSGPPQYSVELVRGEGDTDNDKFRIDSVKEFIGFFYDTTHNLVLIDSADHETQDEYSIRLKTVDSYGTEAEQSFTLTVNDVNESPTDLSLSESNFDENIDSNSDIATLSTSDQDSGDTHTYSLVSGVGDTDNSAFTIDGNQLKIIDAPDFQTKSSYSIRLETKDSGGLSFAKAFDLSVNAVEPTPVPTPSPSPEDTDNDGFLDGVTNYVMWTESGGVDLTNKNGRKFSDKSSRLWDAIKAVQTDTGFSILLKGDRKKQGKYRVWKTNENGRLQSQSPWKSAQQMFENGSEDTFDTDFNGNGHIGFVSPTGISLSTFTFNENLKKGSIISYLSSTDPDPSDTHTYSLVPGSGDTDNSSFTILKDQLKINASPDYETKSSYSIRLRTKDSGGLTFEKSFILSVNDLNEDTVLTREIAQKLVEQQGVDIVIPENYTSIGIDAFLDSKLKSVVIPDGINSIGRAAFAWNKLKKVVIPDSVISVDRDAFYSNKLKNIELTNNIISIGQGAFYGNKLTSIEIGDSVTSIGHLAFHQNPSLEIISISKDATFDLSLFPQGVEIIKRGDPSAIDSDGDGFVDSVTNYQVLTRDGGVDLINKKGRKFSDKSSRMWDAVKAITTDSSIQVLIEGTGKKSGMFRMWFANPLSGKITSQTKWQKESWMTNQGYENIFDYDINDNGVIGS